MTGRYCAAASRATKVYIIDEVPMALDRRLQTRS